MLIKKPGMGDGGQRQFDPATGRPVEAGGSGYMPVPRDAVAGTSQLDALRDALGGTGLLERGHILQGRYEIEQLLGVGGMSVVYRARDLRFANVVRYCAVKEMPDNAPDPRTGELRMATFEREASLLATLNHPSIPKIYDFFTDDGRVYLVLEYIQGQDLESVLEDAGGPLPVDDVLRWSIEISDVLSYLHRHRPQPIVFRDLKPSNIMVSAITGRAILIDFGIAKIFQSDKRGTMIGTEGYSPPEQYRGLADQRVDIYALGATIHHLLTNSDPRLETPFTFNERMPRDLNPLVPQQLEAVIMRALEYNADARWQTAEAMGAALEESTLSGTIPQPQPYFSGGSSLLRPRTSDPVAPQDQQYNLRPTTPPQLPQIQQPQMPQTPPSLPQRPVEQGGAALQWTFAAEDEIRSGGLVAKGVYFFGCYDSNIYAINAKTGEFIWKYSTEAGICTVPAIFNDKVIVGSEDHSLYALDVSNGQVAWRFRSSGPIRSSPRVIQHAIYFGSDDQHVYCIDGRNGTMLWKYATWGPVRSTPVVGRELLYVGSHDGNIHAVDAASGQYKWKLRAGAPVTSSPVVYEGLVIVGSGDQNVYAVDADNGFAIWKFRANHYVNSSPSLDGNRVFVGSVDGNVYSLEAASGRQAWKFDTGSQVISSPRVANGAVYFGAADGTIYCLGAKNGELRWRYKAGGAITANPAFDEGAVIIGSFDSKVYALQM